MARPLRIEFPGAVYHVTSRGDRQEPIFRDSSDRHLMLDVVDRAMERHDAEMLAFSLMGNHYHFVLRTRRANLSRLMRQINGDYTQAFNRRHQVTGHVFQGRFHAVIVDKDAYLVEVCRYVELNAVRAGLVRTVDDWPWCSYGAHIGRDAKPWWLTSAVIHGHLLGREAVTTEDRRQARQLYAATVLAGRDVNPWATHLRQEIYLGEEQFVIEVQAQATQERLRCVDVARIQRTSPRQLADWLTPERSRDEAFRVAHSQGGLSMTEIARQAGLSVSGVSRIIASAERLRESRPDPATFKT